MFPSRKAKHIGSVQLHFVMRFLLKTRPPATTALSHIETHLLNQNRAIAFGAVDAEFPFSEANAKRCQKLVSRVIHRRR